MREGGAEYRMQDPEVGRAEHTQVFRLEKKHKGGVSREGATEYRERVMKWQNPRIPGWTRSYDRKFVTAKRKRP